MTAVARAALRDAAKAFLVSVVETEVEYTFVQNDSAPTTFLDFVADTVTYLQRVLVGDVDDANVLALRELCADDAVEA